MVVFPLQLIAKSAREVVLLLPVESWAGTWSPREDFSLQRSPESLEEPLALSVETYVYAREVVLVLSVESRPGPRSPREVLSM